MNSIVGIAKDERDGGISEELSKMLRAAWGEHSDAFVAVTERGVRRGSSPDDLNPADIGGSRAMAEIYDDSSGNGGSLPAKCGKGDIVVLSDTELFSDLDWTGKGEGGSGQSTDEESRLAELIDSSHRGDLETTIAEVVKRIDGTYALAAFDGDDIVVARDINGIGQLYIGEKGSYAVFSTERRPLWALGIDDIQRVPPGHLARISDRGISLREILSYPSDVKRSITDLDAAVREYERALSEAVRKRIGGAERAGVIFSGGIDSVLIAKLASRFADVTCYCAGLEGSIDLKSAASAARQLGLRINIKELKSEDVEDYVLKAMRAIEDRLFVQIEAAVPVYAAMAAAGEDGQKVVLNGQGADELFGGYPWYRLVLKKEGYPQLEHYMWDDFLNGHRETFEREVKIARANGVHLRIPFTDPEVVRTALKMDTRLKIRSPDDVLGKYVHRELAKRLGIPAVIADRPKEAAQHGSGSHEAILQIAEKRGFNQELVDRIGYDQERSIREKLGSSVRYGYRYSGKDLWTVPDHVQLYLDTLAIEEGLVGAGELQYLARLRGGG